jgi:hypothetical protein
MNAVTKDGIMLSTDRTGNRVVGMIFGPGEVYILAGINKISENLDDAIKRIRTKSSPPTARVHNANTPCATTGVCCNCNSPDRVCAVTVIFEKRPIRTATTVILINEEMGF